MLTGGINGIRAPSEYTGLQVVSDVLDNCKENTIKRRNTSSRSDPPASTPRTSAGTGAANAGAKAAKAAKRAKDLDSMFAVGGDERK
jgi:hypothetical protein